MKAIGAVHSKSVYYRVESYRVTGQVSTKEPTPSLIDVVGWEKLWEKLGVVTSGRSY